MTDETKQDFECVGLGDLIKHLKAHSKQVCIKDKLKDFITIGVIG